MNLPYKEVLLDLYTKDKKEFGDSLDGGLPVVAEDDTCPYWEAAEDVNLTPMRECWYCRFSDFRNETYGRRTHSVCRLPESPIGKPRAY